MLPAPNNPAGEGPMLLLAPGGSTGDWPEQRWSALPGSIAQRLEDLRTLQLSPDLPLNRRAAAVASSDVVLSSCPSVQRLAVYSGVPLVALGAQPVDLPDRQRFAALAPLVISTALTDVEVLQALEVLTTADGPGRLQTSDEPTPAQAAGRSLARSLQRPGGRDPDRCGRLSPDRGLGLGGLSWMVLITISTIGYGEVETLSPLDAW